MKICSPFPVSSAATIAMTTTLVVIILGSSSVGIYAQLPMQQQVESDEGLIAMLNGDSFTTGDTITVSGSVQEGEAGSFVGIEVIDPQGEIVERGVSPLAADYTFNYSFVAGELKEVDIDEPMITSGSYRAVVTYFPPGDPLGMEQAETIFEYRVVTDTDTEDLESTQGVTTYLQPSAVQSTTLFQSIEDGFRLHVPHGWTIQDIANTGSILSQEATQGYGLLAQLCPEEEEQPQEDPTLPDVSDDTFSCQTSGNYVIHIVRYHGLNSVLQSSSNATVNAGGMTSDSIMSYHLQKLQEVGYRDIEVINSADMTVNLTLPQANETIAIMPAKFVEMTYTIASAPDEIRTGYLISTASNSTLPNVGMTKGYTVFYEGNPVSVAELTLGFGSLSSLPPAVKQVFDSFELLAAPQVEQAIAEQSEESTEIVEGPEDEEDQDDEGGDDEGNDDDEEEEDEDE
ncbi:MAG: hypothetical protein M3115_05030 [Thermoproteota archaeon]|nr:hypothetical protein [Thermoproteota archaeon]